MDLVGVQITNVSQVKEVREFSNAVGFRAKSMTKLIEYLSEINNTMVPVISVDYYFFNRDIGRYLDAGIEELLAAIGQSGHIGRIVFLFDEPFWRVRRHHDSDVYHDETLIELQKIRERLLEFEVAHIEAYAELYFQHTKNGSFHLLHSADHIGFDCYGNFNACSTNSLVPKMSQTEYLEHLFVAIQDNGSKAKIALIPGIFVDESGTFKTQGELIEQFYAYMKIYAKHKEKIGMVGGFIWGDIAVTGITGARNLSCIRAVIRHEFMEIQND